MWFQLKHFLQTSQLQFVLNPPISNAPLFIHLIQHTLNLLSEQLKLANLSPWGSWWHSFMSLLSTYSSISSLLDKGSETHTLNIASPQSYQVSILKDIILCYLNENEKERRKWQVEQHLPILKARLRWLILLWQHEVHKILIAHLSFELASELSWGLAWYQSLESKQKKNILCEKK